MGTQPRSDAANLVVKRVSQLVEPVLDEAGIELVDIEYLSERGRCVLRVFVDRDGGITLNDCAQLSREIGVLIDVKDIIQHEYVLEVSSPGLNRPLKKEKDFLWAIGKKVKVQMANPVKGRSNFTGYLKDLKDKMLCLDVENNPVLLPLRDVKKANLIYDFEN